LKNLLLCVVVAFLFLESEGKGSSLLTAAYAQGLHVFEPGTADVTGAYSVTLVQPGKALDAM